MTEVKSRTRTQFQLVREMPNSKYDEVTVGLKETVVVHRGERFTKYGLTPAHCIAIASFCLMVGIDCYFNEKPDKGEAPKKYTLLEMMTIGQSV